MTPKENKIKIIQDLLNEAENLKDFQTDSIEFKSWHSKVTRRLAHVFGENSRTLLLFEKITFTGSLDVDYEDYQDVFSHEQFLNELPKWKFSDGLSEAVLYLRGVLDDILIELDYSVNAEIDFPKVFISHSSSDRHIVTEVVQLLKLIGVRDSSIFCTSLDGYGIPLGKDWLNELRIQISGNVLVLFIVSDNYYQSTVSLCEMGAAWALSKQGIPILIPPMEYSKMKGVVLLNQGFKINEPRKWTQLKSQLETSFNLTQINPVIWEEQRDQILARIERLFET